MAGKRRRDEPGEGKRRGGGDRASGAAPHRRASHAHAHSPGIQPETELAGMLEALQPHDHLCLIYESPEEWRAAVVPFIAIGLRRGEKCLYVVDTSTAGEIRRYLAEEGVDAASAEKLGQLSILHHAEAYTRQGSFDPDAMIALLISETQQAIAGGYPALRVTGEMTWVLRGHPGSEKLLEYEARLNSEVFPHYRCLAICQYDRWKFDPELIRGVVIAHPLIVRGNRVYRNFYYIQPEEFLNEKRAEREVQHWLNSLEREDRERTKLQSTTEYLDRIINGMFDPLIAINRDYGIADVNSRFLERYDMKRDEVIGRKCYEVTHHFAKPCTGAGHVCPVRAVFTEGMPAKVEHIHKDRDGRDLVFEIYCFPLYGPTGEVQSVVEVQHDITAQRQADRVLRESEEKYRSLVNNIDVGVFRSTPGPHGRFLEVNPAMERITGYSREELLRIDVAMLYLDPEERVKAIREAEQAGGVSMRETLCRSRDGSEFVVADTTVPVRDSEGRVVHFDGILVDITAQRRAEEVLRESEERYRTLFERTTNPILVIDTEGNYLDGNEAALRFLECTREELAGKSVRDFSPPVKKKVMDEHRSLWRKGGAVETEYNVNGELKTLYLTITPGTWRGQPAVFGVGTDITERKQVEEALAVGHARLLSILDGVNTAAYVADTETYEVLYVNKHLKDLFGKDPTGGRCYEEFQGLDHPCEFCTNDIILKEKGKVYQWEYRNPVVNRDYVLFDRIITWPDGRDVRFEFCMDITERKEAEERVRHLNRVLRAIRDVNQLITKRPDRESLLEGACRTFVETRGYHSAWIVLLDDSGKPVATAEAGLGRSFAPVRRSIKAGELPNCGRRALENSGVVVISDQSSECTGCPAVEQQTGRGGMSIRLEHDGKVYGTMTVSLAGGFAAEKEEQELFEEVAGDIAFALYSIELEEKRTEAEEGLRMSEQNFRDSIEESPLGIRIVTDDGKTLYVNKALLDLCGYGSLEELLAVPRKQIHTPESYAEHRKRVSMRRRGEQVPADYEASIVRKDGQVRHLWVSRKEVLWNGERRFQIVYQDITERKQAEEALKAQTAYFQQLFDSSPDAIAMLDTDDRVIRVNRGFEALFGYSSEEITGRSLDDLVIPGHLLDEGSVSYERALDGGVIRKETQRRRKDGTPVSVSVLGYPIRTKDEVLGVYVIYSDITERKQAEAAREEAERSYRLLAENTVDVVSIFDLDLNLLWVSPSAVKQTGYTAEELMTLPVDRTMTPESIEKAMEVFNLGKRLYDQGEDFADSYEMEGEVYRKDGSTFWSENRYRLVRDREGRPAYILMQSRDITERRWAEAAVREAEERYRALFDRSRDLIYVVSFEGTFLDANEAMLRRTGYEREELPRLSLADLLSEEQRAEAVVRIQKLRETGAQNEPKEYSIRCKDGSWVSIEVAAAVVYRDGSPYAVQGLGRDLTERKEMEEQLILTDRLASIGQLASGIAHELNNPLTSVIGFSEMLMSRDLPADVKEDLEVINSEARRTSDVVKGLLAFARKQSTDKVAVDINRIIQSVLQLRAYEQRVSNIAVDARLASDLPPVTGNGPQLQQVFINIIINAEQEMIEAHGRGRLTIITELIGDRVRATIADDGPGIRPDVMNRLFTPFLTTKEVGRGTGLGLSICHGIVTEHGGRIYAESKPGEGAAFVVELPAANR